MVLSYGETGAGGGLGLRGVSLIASNPPSCPQGANILINDAGEVRLGECGWWGCAGGLVGGHRG